MLAAGVDIAQNAQGEVRSSEVISTQGKWITIDSTEKTTLQGKNLASGNIQVNASEANLDNSQISAQTINITASQGNIQADNAAIVAEKYVRLTTPSLLQTQNSYVKAEKISSQQRSLNTQNATWEQTGTSELQLNVVDMLQNQGGTFKTQGDLIVNANGMNNQQGRLIAGSLLVINAAQGKVDTTQGALVSAQNLEITSGELINDKGLIQSHKNVAINTQGQMLSNQQTLTDAQDKGIVALGNIEVQSSNWLNQQGRVVSLGKQTFNVADIDNNQGVIYTQQNLAISGVNLTNTQGKINAVKQANVALLGNFNQQNGVVEAQSLNFVVNALNSSAQSLILADNLNTTISGEINNQDSRIIANQNGNIQTNGILNNTNGTLGSLQGNLTVNTHYHRVENEKGNIVASQHITLDSGAINNKQGLITSDNMALNSHNQEINNQETLSENRDKGIISKHLLMLNSGSLVNDKGNIFSHNNSVINTSALINHYGEIRTQSQLDVNANTIEQNAGLITANIVNLASQIIRSNQQSEISGHQVNVTAQSLDNKGSKLISRQRANIDVQHGIENQYGTIASLGEQLSINTHQAELNNAGGIIVAPNGTLQLKANALDNKAGIVRAQTAEMTVAQHIDNRDTLANEAQGIIASNLSVNTKTLDNQGGRITAFNRANIQTTDIQNQRGEILMVNDGVLNANNINNQAGTIASTSANLNIETQTALNNQRGTLSAADKLTLNTQGLANQYGNVTSSNQLVLNTAQQLVNNQGGRIFAKNQATIDSGEINNQQGLIRADNLLSLQTNQRTIDNSHTQGKEQGIVGLGQIILQNVENLLNPQGKLYAENALNIDVQNYTNNQEGSIQSNGSLVLSSQEIHNQVGKIVAKNTANVTAKQIDNRAISEVGSFIYADALTLNVQQLDNQGTKANAKVPTQGIQGKDITVQASTLNNRQGGIYSSNSTTINANQRLDNQQGELLSGNAITIQNGEHLMLNNQNGTIQGQNMVSLTAKGLESEGIIKTEGDLSVSLKDSFTLNNAFEVGNNLTFKTEGDFTNHAEQTVANKMAITANSIVNSVNAELSANETTLNTNTLTNRGLIDGNKTLINSTKVTNIGMGRIYGDHLAFRANTVENLAETINGETKAGTIAARERLDFGVGKLINRDHALILSLGDMAIGGDLDANGNAIGQADFVDNGSATIEVLGNGNVNISKLFNHDLYLKLGINTTVEDVEEIALESKPTERYRVNVDGYYNWSGRNAWFKFYDESKPTLFEKQFYVWRYKQTTHTPYIDKQDKAKFNIGGNLYLNGDDLHNKYSQMAIGGKLFLGGYEFSSNQGNFSLSANGITLKNEDIEKIISIDENGEALFLQHYKRHGNHGHRHAFIKEHKPPTKVINSSFNEVLNTIGTPISSNATVSEKPQAKDIQLDTVSVAPLKTDKLGDLNVSQDQLSDKGKQKIVLTPIIDRDDVIDSGQVISKLHTLVDKSDSLDLGNMTMPMVKTHLKDMRLPEASLYRVNPEAPNGYLVETDPKFTDRKQWLSSDYMFEALRYNYDNTHKRLGDGFYEQRLINEQINQLTGRRYLEGYHNDLEQYKALMNSGIKYAQQFNLSVGVGLTAKQMSELTTDMVWLVNKEVTLADGKKVTALVPQVYLVARDSDISARGAVISANQIIGNMGELHNSGVIAGRDLTRLYSNQLENQGTILGKSVDLSAKQNLINLGGRIEAVESLTLFAGKNLEIASTLSSNKSEDGNFAHTVLDQLSSLKVTGEGGRMVLHSDGNVTIKAANVESNGTLSAVAGNALQITTLNTLNKAHYNGNADNYYRLDQQAEVGSSLIGKDGVTLIANNDATLRQTDISSENGNVLVGSRMGDITIENGRASEQLATSIKSTSKGLLSKTTTVARHLHHTTNAEASNLDGQEVTLIAQQGNVTVKGSNVVAESTLGIVAKENVSILSDVNTHYQEDEVTRRKSGLMGSGGIGFTIGSKKENIDQDRTQESAARSQVGSLMGNTTINAGRHYQQTGSVVTSANGDVDIFAQSANITAARSDYESNYKRTTEQKGVTVALTGAVASAIQAVDSTTKSIKALGSSKNDRINALAAANSGFEALRTAGQLQNIANAISAGSATGGAVGISVTYGQQKSTETQHSEGNTAEKSQVNSGGKVRIQTTGKDTESTLTIAGSDVSGQKGTHLKAEGKVNIEAVDENHLERSQNKSSGVNVGVALQFGNGIAAGITAGGNVAKGYGNGNSQAWVASQVGDKNSFTTIESGSDTDVIGSQVQGKRIKVNAENLNIQSVQDTAKYEGKQEHVQGQITVGYGASVEGSYNKSKVNSDYASVKTQAGIFAGDEGYDVNVRKHTELTGALVTSTDQAEQADKNRFSTETLNSQNIDNHADYSGRSIGISGSVAMNFDTPFGNAETGIAQSQTQATNKKGEKIYEAEGIQNTNGVGNPVLASGWDSLQTSAGFGAGRVNESNKNVTRSGINTAHINIRNEQAQLEQMGETVDETLAQIKTNVSTDTAEINSGKVENSFNKDKVLKELNIQVKATKEFRQNAFSIIDAYVLPKQAELREKIKRAQTKDEKTEIYKEIYKLQYQKRLLETTVGIVTGTSGLAITQGTLQLAATKMREETLENSRIFKGIKDAKTGQVLKNDSYDSGYFDGVKLGGVRIDLDVICGADRCSKNDDESIIYKGNNSLPTLLDAIDPDKNTYASGLYGETGGFQSVEGEWNLHFMRIPYSEGSISDKIVESFAGTHDMIGGQMWGWYDEQGNTLQNKNVFQTVGSTATTVIAIPIAAPFAVSDAISSDFMEILFKLGGH